MFQGNKKISEICETVNISICVNLCPGFGQDKVNFHQNPGRGTAGWADPTPTWPDRAGYSIPCAVMLVSGGGGSAVGTHSRLGRAQWRLGPRERFCSAGSVLRVCSV